MEEMVEVRKEVSDMPCGNAIPAEDAGHQTEKDVAGRESDRVPAPEMNPKEEVKAFLAEMDLNGISIFNVGSNTVTLASGWDLMAFIRQMISPENGGDAQ